MDTEKLIDQVATLWPYLTFMERLDWARRIALANGWDKSNWPKAVNLITEKANEV